MSSFVFTQVKEYIPPEKLLINNRNFFAGLLGKKIKDLKNMINQLSQYLPSLNELVKILEDRRNTFLSNYTLDILNSPNHKNWVNEEVRKFDDLVLKSKSLITLINSEIKKGLSLDSLKLIYQHIPKECSSLRKEVESFITLLEKIEEAKQKRDIEELENFYKKLPLFFSEERQKLANELLKIKLNKEKNKQKEQIKEKQIKTCKVKRLKKEAENFYQKLLKIRPSEEQNLKPLFEELKTSNDVARIEGITKEIKYRYIKIKEKHVLSEILKKDIHNIYADVDIPEIKKMIKEFLSKELVSREEYEILTENIRNLLIEEEKKENKLYAEQVVKFLYEKLIKMGYYTVDEKIMEKLMNQEVVEINTPFGEDYILRVKFNADNHSLAIRFVRHVEDEESLTEYEKQKDISIAKEWCKTYDKLADLLRKNGVFLEKINRIEPEKRFYYEIKKKREEKKKTEQEKGQDYLRKHL